MGQKNYHYFRIPTVAGNFYLYREYERQTFQGADDDDIHYGPIKEFFTGITCGDGFDSDLLDTNKESDKLKLELIRSELEKRQIDVDYLLSYTPYISYKSIHFAGVHYPVYGDEPSYNLFEGSAEFVIEKAPVEYIESYCWPKYSRYQISPVEFAEEIQKLIDKYGSKEKVAEIMLKRIKNKADETNRQKEYVKNELNKTAEANDEAEAYIKKFLN